MECLGRRQKDLYCSAKLLDETELNLDVQKNTKGSVLLDKVYQRLNLLEADYFGLRYLDSQNQTHWLDPNKAISKQIKNGPPYMLYFGVKFYMENPCKLKEEVTRYQFFLQLRMDMLQGRLPCSFHAAAELCAYSTQSELGDYDPARHSDGYISEFRFIPSQTPELEQHITELHKKLKGLSPSKAELSFLERARWLDMYGVDLHPVLGENNVEFFLGLTPTGVVVYKNKTKVARYYWPRISKVYFKDTEFTLVVQNMDGDEDDCVFKLSTRSACKHLWKCCVEQHAFFRLPQAGDEPIHQRKLSFSGSSFRHTGRTQREALEASSELSRPEQQVNRAPSRKYNRRLSQTDISLKNVTSDDAVFIDDNNPSSPNGILLRLSPQPAHRLSTHRGQSGRGSPTSGISTRSVPWEDAEQARMGLFTPPGSSPVSVRSSASRHRHRARSKSPGPSHRHGDRSESESEAAYSSRRRRRRSVVSSDGGSDHESYHHQHRKRRSRSRGASSGSESEFSKHDDDRRRRRRERMVNSDGQWKAREEKKSERGELREGQGIIVKRLRDGVLVDDPTDVEFQKHIKKDLVDPAQYTEEERRNIPYTNVVTESATTNGHHRHHHRHGHSRSRSKRSEDFSDGTASEHSTRHYRKPDGTPPPPYSANGANRRIDSPHKVKDSQLDSRGDPDRRDDVLIQNGYLTSGGGLFGGRHQSDTNQNQRLHNHTATAQSIHTNGTHDRHAQRYPPTTHQGSTPTLGMEELCVTHSREDSGLGNEHDYTERQTTTQTLRRNVLNQNDDDPLSSGDVTDLRSTTHSSQVITSRSEGHPSSASQSGTRRHPQNARTEVTQSNGQAPARSHHHHNGGPHYPQKLRLPHSTNKLSQDVTHKGAPYIHNNNTEKRSDHLWSAPIEPHHSCKTSSLVDERDMHVHKGTAGNQGDTVSDELPDFPPGYKPSSSRGFKRYSITTQEMIRVSTLNGDHHDLLTEL
ncbi:band 4.1-like protein 4A isoform X1 [Asterias amurensis]|uniref:band 4.1-like protein 4A isoform X1 n=1 Tax=Asterias amurensis TaxID=7602 RepID=UPI003AB40697